MVNMSLPRMLMMILVGGLFITAITLSLDDMSSEYEEVKVTGRVNTTLTNYTQGFRQTQDMARDIKNRTEGTQASQDVDVGISLESALSALNLVWNSFGIVTGMVESTATTLNINGIFIWALIGVMMLFVGFTFLSAVLKHNL